MEQKENAEGYMGGLGGRKGNNLENAKEKNQQAPTVPSCSISASVVATSLSNSDQNRNCSAPTQFSTNTAVSQ